MYVKGLIKRIALPLIRMVTYIEAPLNHHVVDIEKDQVVVLLNNTSLPESRCVVTAHHEITKRYDLMVVVPVYNVAPYLRDCIESLLSQRTDYSFHIVIVDDGSMDESSEILRNYECDEKITVISKKNGGIASARNAALRHIVGRYITFVDSDDVVMPHAFEAMLNVAFRWDADVVEGSVEFFNGGTVVETQLRRQSQNSHDTTHALRGQPWAKLYRAELFRDIQFPEGYLYEDSILVYCVHPRVRRAYTVNNIVYRYRINPNGITNASKNLTKSLDTVRITDCLFRYYIEHFPNTPMMEQLMTLLGQIALNYKRTQQLDTPIRRAVFAMSCDWFHQYFDHYDMKSLRGKYRVLAKALAKHDYGEYECSARVGVF